MHGQYPILDPMARYVGSAAVRGFPASGARNRSAVVNVPGELLPERCIEFWLVTRRAFASGACRAARPTDARGLQFVGDTSGALDFVEDRTP